MGYCAAHCRVTPCGECIESERDFYRAELKEAHTWMLAQGWCDCEYFEGAGTKPCRFAEALARKVPA